MQTSTSYLGLRLPHPFVAGASPFGHRLDTVKQLEDAGWAAVVLHSLFEEQITADHDGCIRHMDPADPLFAERLAYFPHADDYALAPDAYAELELNLYEVVTSLAVPAATWKPGSWGSSGS